MPDLEAEFIKRAQAKCPTVVFPEAEDATIAQAAAEAADKGVCKSVLIGSSEKIAASGINLSMVTIIDLAGAADKVAELAKAYAEREDFPLEIAESMLKGNPLNFACMLVATGDADGLVAGFTHPTADVVLAAQEYIGLSADASIPSAYVIVEPDNFTGGEDGQLIYADPVMVIQPNAEELASIALNTAASAERLLGWIPRVACLSFSTKESGGHPDAEKVRQAVAIVRAKRPDLLIDGELQLDAAIVPEVSEKKIKSENLLHGDANILIFPDCDAGNICVKASQLFAHAGGSFAILCGFAKPVGELSRNSNVDQIVFSTAVTAAQC